MSTSLHIGYFEDPRDLLEAARECRRRLIPISDVVSPAPIHGLDEVLGLRPSRLPWVTLWAGLLGAGLGFLLEYWTAAVNWPLNVGGKPLDSLPAFIPVAFELTILLAGLATAAGLFWRSKLWPGRRRPKLHGRTSDDWNALILAQRDGSFAFEEFVGVLERHGAVERSFQAEGLS